jgi:hypothetical protein
MKLSKVFFPGIKSTSRSISLDSLKVPFEKEASNPILETPNPLITSRFEVITDKSSSLELSLIGFFG